MSERVEVSVIQDDIDRGCEGDADNCPLARAFKRKGYAFTSITHTDVIVGTGRDEWKGDLPPEARAFVRDYDDNKAVGPFSFPIFLEHSSRIDLDTE